MSFSFFWQWQPASLYPLYLSTQGRPMSGIIGNHKVWKAKKTPLSCLSWKGFHEIATWFCDVVTSTAVTRFAAWRTVYRLCSPPRSTVCLSVCMSVCLWTFWLAFLYYYHGRKINYWHQLLFCWQRRSARYSIRVVLVRLWFMTYRVGILNCTGLGRITGDIDTIVDGDSSKFIVNFSKWNAV